MADRQQSKKERSSRLIDRFLKEKPQFKPYKIDLAADLHDWLYKLATDTGMSKEAINNAINFAIRTLLTRLEREVCQANEK